MTKIPRATAKPWGSQKINEYLEKANLEACPSTLGQMWEWFQVASDNPEASLWGGGGLIHQDMRIVHNEFCELVIYKI